MFMTALITVLAAYLLGSINFAVIFTNLFSHTDIRNYGSGNAGATNVMRVGGFVPALLTFICDALKGFLSCLLGHLIFSFIYAKTGNSLYLPIYGEYFCGVFVMVGHIFPVFFDFKGGKGVATGMGAMFMCSPIAILIGLAVFLIVVLITKIVSLSSISATAVAVILSMFLYNRSIKAKFFPQAILALIMGAIIIIKHLPNIKRLLSGQEPRLQIRRNK